MAEREYIARISYGKDSLKMLEVIHSRGLPLDRITTTDVWATDTICANLPPMDAFKARMDERIWQLYRIEVEHLCARNKDGSKRTYEQMFYHVPNRRSQIGQVEREREPDRARLHPGIPGTRNTLVPIDSQAICSTTECRAASRDFHCPERGTESSGAKTSRQPVFSNERPVRRKDRNIIEYLGIAADEPARFGQLNAKKRAPLVEFGIEEDLCGLYCQYNDMLAPTYETSCRDGCWFCHNQGVDQLRLLRRNYPDLWALLMKWDLDSPVTFKADGHTVHDFDRRFEMEDLGLVPTDRTFRWKMLDEPPKFRAWEFEQMSLFG